MKRKAKTPPDLRTALAQRKFLFFFGICLVLITASILWFNGRATTLNCQRLEPTQVDCVSQVKWLGVVPLTSRTIPQVQAASLSSNCSAAQSDRVETCVYGVNLLTAAGEIAISPALASGDNKEEKEAFVAQVNAFITNPNSPSLQATQTELGRQTWVLAGIMLFGLMMVLVNLRRAVKAASRI